MTDRFKMIGAVYALLRKDDKVLLLRRANTGYQDGKFGLVSGHMNGGEPATKAMIREAQEEAGVTIAPEDLKLVHVTHKISSQAGGQDERLELFFEASNWDGEITNAEPHKCTELTWFPINDLPTDTIPFIKLVIQNIVAGKMFSEYEMEPA
ncbi:MAG: putative hydrolase [Candidatus Saccharibacteria bacterium]|nr:putative hydrolase [Candidatus Saccharibacteria bacterium]